MPSVQSRIEVYDIASLANTLKQGAEKRGFPPIVFMNTGYSQSVDRTLMDGSNYGELGGLIKEKIEDQGSAVILYSFLPIGKLTEDHRFYGLLGYKRAGFIRLPQSLNSLKVEAERMQDMPNIKDDIAFYAAELINKGTKIRSLLHNLEPHKIGTDIARKAVLGTNENFGTFFNPDTEQVDTRRYLTTYEPDTKSRFANQRLTGVFCDVDGTFIDSATGDVNRRVLDVLSDYDKNTFVHLWSGGTDESKVRKILAKEGKPWMVLSKRDFRDTNPDIVIDDMDQNTFEQTYGIKPKTFVPVKDI